MGKKCVTPFGPVYPTCAALITSSAEDGVPNVTACDRVFNVSLRDPVVIGIGIMPGSYSHELIYRSGEFVLNVPTAALVRQVDLCGSVSGRETSRFDLTGLRPVAASKVKPPLLAERPVNAECRVSGVHAVAGFDFFFGEVLALHVDEAALDRHGDFRADRVAPLCYACGAYMSAEKVLGWVKFTGHGD